MGMKKINYEKMEQELLKADSEAISDMGYAVNEKTAPIMIKYGFLQSDKDRTDAAKYNKQLLRDFKSYLKKNKKTLWAGANVEWYIELNRSSGHTLRFDDVDEEHFNYLLFNRCIRKIMGMSEKGYLDVLKSFKIFSVFLKEKNVKTSDLFFRISQQKEKMIKRLKDYDFLEKELGEEKLSDEEFCEKTDNLFGYGYLE